MFSPSSEKAINRKFIIRWVIIGAISTVLWITLSPFTSFFSWIFGGVTSYCAFMIIWLVIQGELATTKPRQDKQPKKNRSKMKTDEPDPRYLDPAFRRAIVFRYLFIVITLITFGIILAFLFLE